MSNDGKAVARLDRLVIFVRGGVPGDEVRARITRARRKYAEATILEVLKSSPSRTAPRCRYFGVCGGCDWQQLTYDAQLEVKQRHVQESLERIGGIRTPEVNRVHGMADPYFYRNKMEFSFGERWLSAEEIERHGDSVLSKDERFALGLHIPERFDKVLDIEECWLQSLRSTRIVNVVRAFCRDEKLSIYSTRTHEGYLRNLVIREANYTQDLMVNLVTSEDRPELMTRLRDRLLKDVPEITTICNNITQRKSQVAVGEVERIYHGPGTITERLGAKLFRISANSFFQTNTRQTETLYATVRRLASLTPSDVVFDLYSGAGTIAVFVADDVAEVVGVESSEAAVADARQNAELNRVTNCTFILGDLKEMLTRDSRWLSDHPPPTVVIIDPPRAGAHEEVLREIRRLQPKRIIYVSCNPATQARDLAFLCREGRYWVEEIQPVDMFPHTRHVENVVSLSAS